MNSVDLSTVSTAAPVRELTCRDGVSVCYVDPYENKTIQVEGAAVVLTVVD